MATLNKLTDRSVQAFLKRAKAGQKISDGGALYLLRTPAGSAAWRINYRHGGRYRTYAIGLYPTIGLAEARQERDRVKQLLTRGIDPVFAKREERVRNIANTKAGAEGPKTFQQFALEWLERRAIKKSWSEVHKRQVRQSLERYLFPRIGSVPVASVTLDMLSEAVTPLIKAKRYETAGKLLQNLTLIFKSARLRRHRADNPAEGLADELIPTGQLPNRRPALTKFSELGDVLRRTELAPIAPQVRLALKLVAHSAARIGNVLEARWEEFDLDSDTPAWVIPRPQMKVKRRPFDHRVLLTATIAADLRAWRSFTGGKGYVFPAPAGASHLRHETLEKVYRRTLGLHGKHSVHGWRASFSTLAKDSGLFSKDAVNLALDHVHDSDVALVYDRGERLEERKKLAAWWDSELSRAQNAGAH